MNRCDNKVSTLLQCARDLITDPAQWTQGVLARRADGTMSSPTSRDACSFCSLGAIQKCLPLQEAHLFDAATRVLATQTFRKGSIAQFNDSSSHLRVLFAFDEAIKTAKEMEKENG